MKSGPEERQEGLLVLTQPQSFSDPARRLLSCLEQFNVPPITLLGTTDVPSHKLPMAQLKFKDCGFSLDLRNPAMVPATSQPRSPQKADKCTPRLEVAHAIPSLLLLFKVHWQHLSLCGHNAMQ